MLDLDSSAFTPLNDLPRQLVYCELGASVRMTMVAGRIVCEEGRVTLVDEAAIRAEARDLAARSVRDRAESDRSAAELMPYYREMYLRASAQSVGLSRKLGADERRLQ
jgi:5-methylthioadenosine/S-adenosylhomocysteine deaminase